ncbi:hypothetical protein JTE90_014607 [Oedothorax gibbosus]|uniref:Uncharacterized protein n=1 Tax=Oedothorax gibbosus TaxID=931172 RepID=A0AAV6V9G9_9ARAC|nr:hypothetical protein JTE90_014607 [Oedothorax gibbosus]
MKHTKPQRSSFATDPRPNPHLIVNDSSNFPTFPAKLNLRLRVQHIPYIFMLTGLKRSSSLGGLPCHAFVPIQIDDSLFNGGTGPNLQELTPLYPTPYVD